MVPRILHLHDADGFPQPCGVRIQGCCRVPPYRGAGSREQACRSAVRVLHWRRAPPLDYAAGVAAYGVLELGGAGTFMHAFLVTLHVLSAAIVVGVLFLQSLAVVMALRLPADAQRQGVRILQGRIHAFIYYPILGVTLITGLWNALAVDAFATGRWLHWKLVFVVLLVGLGLLTGRGIRAERPLRPLAMIVHIAIFVVAGCIVYLAVLKPY